MKPISRRTLLALQTAIGMAVALPPALAQTPAGKADALIQAARAATGGAAWDRITSWHERGKLTAGGLSGTYDAWNDFPRLLQSQSYDLGPASGSQGWDGKSAWSTDSSKQVRVEAAGEPVAAAIQSAYVATYAAFFPQRWAAQEEYVGQRHVDGATYDAMKLVPKGAEPIEIWFDPASHRIARVVQLTGSQPQTFLLDQYKSANGVVVPFHTVARVGGNPKYDQSTEVTSISLTDPAPKGIYAPPMPPAYDATFPNGQSSVTIPFVLRNNHIYLAASIDGKPAQTFVFDTGATNFLDAGHASKLGVKAEGALPGGGFGSDIAAVGLAKLGSVSLGGLTLHDQVFAIEDSAAWLQVEGADSGGLLGYEFAKRAVMTIDYGHGKMTFTKPEAFTPPAGVTAIPFKFDAHIPMVEGSVDGTDGEFEIDTGSRGSLTLMHPFAAAHDLVSKYHATHLATTGYGVGGPSRALLARVGTLKIGPVTIEKPVTDLVNDKAGAAAAARTAGNIGGDLLKRFTVTLDYGHQLMWLQPNALAATPDVFDRSGLWINRAKDGNIGVADVSADSAATEAGVHVGEEITSVNGRTAKKLEVYDLREMFKQTPGTSFKLQIQGPTGVRSVRLNLADQV